jgi:hypothetical protein
MEEWMAILAISVTTLVVIFMAKSAIKTKAQKNAERNMIFKDEMIYDPESGREFSIEEAEHIVIPVDEDRLIPDNELEKYFNETYHEIEYLRRLFASHNIHELKMFHNIQICSTIVN